jgi:hypothetical protein
MLLHQSRCDTEPDNPIVGYLFFHVLSIRLRTPDGKRVHNDITDLAKHQTLQILSRLAARPNNSGFCIDTSALTDTHSALYKRLQAHTKPELSIAYGDISSDNDAISVYLPALAPGPTGESIDRPPLLFLDVPAAFTTSEGTILSHRAHAHLAPLYHQFDQDFCSISATHAADTTGRMWLRLINFTFLHQAYEVTMSGLIDGLTFLIRCALTPTQWKHLRPQIMIIPTTQDINTHTNGRLGRVRRGLGLALYLHTDPSSGDQHRARTALMKALLGDYHTTVHHTTVLGIPVTLTTPVPSSPENLVRHTDLPPSLQTNGQYWIYFRRLPPWLTAHMLFLFLGHAFQCTDIRAIFSVMEFFNDETIFDGARHDRTFIVSLSTLPALQHMMATNNRPVLLKGFTSLIRSAFNDDELVEAASDPHYYDTITVASPNLTGKSPANFKQCTALEANRSAPRLVLTPITQAELLHLAASEDADTEYPHLITPPLPDDDDVMSQASTEFITPPGPPPRASTSSHVSSSTPTAMATPPRGSTAQAATTPHAATTYRAESIQLPLNPMHRRDTNLRDLIMDQLHDDPANHHPRSEADQSTAVAYLLSIISEALAHCPRPRVQQTIDNWSNVVLSNARDDDLLQPPSFYQEDSSGTQLDRP